MPKYNIISWNPVQPKCSQFPFPMVYIAPESSGQSLPDFFKFSKANNNVFKVTFSGTNTTFDKLALTGFVDSTLNFPNYRPNFFEKNKYIAVTIMSKWWGYPPNNGIITLQGIAGPDKVMIEEPAIYQAPKPLIPFGNDQVMVENYGPTTMPLALNHRQLGFYVGVIIIIILLLIFLPSVLKK